MFNSWRQSDVYMRQYYATDSLDNGLSAVRHQAIISTNDG